MQIVVSELVTNALRSGASRSIAMLERQRGVRLLVWDDGPGEPRPREPDSVTESGRGLCLVLGLAAEWGHYAAPESGKFVWARLDDQP